MRSQTWTPLPIICLLSLFWSLLLSSIRIKPSNSLLKPLHIFAYFMAPSRWKWSFERIRFKEMLLGAWRNPSWCWFFNLFLQLNRKEPREVVRVDTRARLPNAPLYNLSHGNWPWPHLGFLMSLMRKPALSSRAYSELWLHIVSTVCQLLLPSEIQIEGS